MSTAWFRYRDLLTDEGCFDLDGDYIGHTYEGNALRVELVCQEYPVLRPTPRGVWLRVPYRKPRWVSTTGRIRFAYPTKELALDSFHIRKLKQIGHAEASIKRARAALKLILNIMGEPS